MLVHSPGGSHCHLCYCSNIHAGESWRAVFANLERHTSAVRTELSRLCAKAPSGPMAIGLRLSAEAARELSEPGELEVFKAWLHAEEAWVPTINGFPYGPFHGTPVKEAVYRPDWREVERLDYTRRLAMLLDQLLPPDTPGTISTVPGAFKSLIGTADDVEAMRNHYVAGAILLAEIALRGGASITLAVEPEPCCFMETIDETIEFFSRELFGERSQDQFAAAFGCTRSEAEALLRKHLGVCVDVCHAAVEFEDPEAMFDALTAAGISVAKLQISAGLRVAAVNPTTRKALQNWVDEVYLHQVVEQGPEGVVRYTDLPEALAAWDRLDAESKSHSREWRIHFHIPIYHDVVEPFHSTRPFIEQVLQRQRRQALSQHLEVETYTWDVLPAAARGQSVDSDIARELAWVIDQLQQ